MLADVLPYLACPHCRSALSLADGTLRCADRHTFDVARQGYVNLLPGNGFGDTSDMVDARARFLDVGHFGPLIGAVADAAGVAAGDGCVVDLGAGTGHYLAAVLDRTGRVGLALDAAKAAARRAARAHPRIGAVVCDAWRELPVRDAAAAVLLNVFAPRNPDEIGRVLARDGVLVVVTPTERHLGRLVSELDLLRVPAGKPDQLDRTLAAFRLTARDQVEFTMSLSGPDVHAVVGMGPSAWHTSAPRLREQVAALPEPIPVVASVTVSSYRAGENPVW